MADWAPTYRPNGDMTPLGPPKQSFTKPVPVKSHAPLIGGLLLGPFGFAIGMGIAYMKGRHQAQAEGPAPQRPMPPPRPEPEHSNPHEWGGL